MKVLICGVPTQQMPRVTERFRSADVRCLCNRQSERAWLRHITPADLCIIIPKHISHKVTRIVQSVFGRQYIAAASVNDAVRIADEALHTPMLTTFDGPDNMLACLREESP